MHAFDPTVSHYNGHMLRNLSKYYLFICRKQSSSTHFCHFLATTFVTDVLMGANPSVMGPKTKGPHSWEPVKSVVGDEGCRVRLAPPASASGLRPSRAALENACAFPQLRTLAGSNPTKWAHTKTVPFRGPFPIRWWAMRDVRVRLAPPALASGLWPSRAALENASRFLSSAPLRVRIPLRWAQKERPPSLEV